MKKIYNLLLSISSATFLSQALAANHSYSFESIDTFDAYFGHPLPFSPNTSNFDFDIQVGDTISLTYKAVQGYVFASGSIFFDYAYSGIPISLIFNNNGLRSFETGYKIYNNDVELLSQSTSSGLWGSRSVTPDSYYLSIPENMYFDKLVWTTTLTSSSVSDGTGSINTTFIDGIIYQNLGNSALSLDLPTFPAGGENPKNPQDTQNHSPLPEPSSAYLVCTSLIFLAFCKHRRKNQDKLSRLNNFKAYVHSKLRMKLVTKDIFHFAFLRQQDQQRS